MDILFRLYWFKYTKYLEKIKMPIFRVLMNNLEHETSIGIVEMSKMNTIFIDVFFGLQ